MDEEMEWAAGMSQQTLGGGRCGARHARAGGALGWLTPLLPSRRITGTDTRGRCADARHSVRSRLPHRWRGDAGHAVTRCAAVQENAPSPLIYPPHLPLISVNRG